MKTQETAFFLAEAAAQSSRRESKTPSFSILARRRDNQRREAQVHPKGYPKGMTCGCPPVIPRVRPALNGLFYGVLRTLARNEFRLGGFVRGAEFA
jgi:hypothetical protein